MNIRQAEKEDISALCRLMQHVQSLHAKAHPDIFLATLDHHGAEDFFAQLMANPRNLVLVSEDGRVVIGYVWCEERTGGAGFHRRESRSAYIHHVSVDPDRWRKGIGKALVERALCEMAGRGAESVGVDYWSFNKPAREFFASLGFVPQREVCSRRLI